MTAPARRHESYPLDSPAEIYHESSKLFRTAGAANVSNQTAQATLSHGVKVYASSPKIELQPAVPQTPTSLLELVLRRRSSRHFAGSEVPLSALGTILYSAYGQTDGRSILRTVPSGGALYPLELYVITLVDGEIARGIYHYDVRGHSLELIPCQSDVDGIRATIFVEEAAETASLFIVTTAVFGRGRIKYGERAYRFSLLEAGHVAQNIALTCESIGLGFCPFGGFLDDAVNDLISVDGVDEAALYLGAIGPLPDS